MNYMTFRARMSEIKKASHSMDDSELERRIDEGDFDIEPDECLLQEMEFRSYALGVVEAVREKDYTVWRYPVPYFGFFGMGAGTYEGMTGDAEKGLAYMIAGTAVLLGGIVLKNLLLLRCARKTIKYLEKEGYQMFDSYYREREPYDFYKTKVLGKGE
jgi:hypothetical protein